MRAPAIVVSPEDCYQPRAGLTQAAIRPVVVTTLLRNAAIVSMLNTEEVCAHDLREALDAVAASLQQAAALMQKVQP